MHSGFFLKFTFWVSLCVNQRYQEKSDRNFKVFCLAQYTVVTPNDSGGSKGRPPTDQHFLNFMQFLGKFICWRLALEGWRPSYGESWIRLCKCIPIYPANLVPKQRYLSHLPCSKRSNCFHAEQKIHACV